MDFNQAPILTDDGRVLLWVVLIAIAAVVGASLVMDSVISYRVGFGRGFDQAAHLRGLV